MDSFFYPTTSGIAAGATTSIASSTIDYSYLASEDKEEIEYNFTVIDKLRSILNCFYPNSITMEYYKSKADLTKKRKGKCLCFKFESLNSFIKFICCCECFNQRKNFENSVELKNKAIDYVAKCIFYYIVNLDVNNNEIDAFKKQVMMKSINIFFQGRRDEYQLCELLEKFVSSLNNVPANLRTQIISFQQTIA